MHPFTILTSRIQGEVDVVLARQRARQIAELLGLDAVEQTRVATAVSEIARNAFRYAEGGRAEFLVDPAPSPLFLVRITDNGPGIADLSSHLEAEAGLGTGRSAGIGVARRLVDRFEVDSAPDRGSTVVLGVSLSRAGEFTRERLGEVAAELARRPPESLLEELHNQNQELAGVLDDLTRRQRELASLNQELEETNRGVLALYSQVAQELEDTNRGVLALYAELDDRVEELRRAGWLQRQFFSYLSHEFRTPLHSTVALSNLLLGDEQPSLAAEHRTHVGLIQRSAGELLELVGDLLDLVRVDAGKLEVQPEVFEAAELCSALRGMFRPLTPDGPVSLVVDEAAGLPPLHTDRRKVAQILRNLVANALKFTARGEIRVSVAPREDADEVEFTVADTGVGLRVEDRARIFEDFVQAENPFQRRSTGSGLGLPLSRRLAELLGGRLSVESEMGVGSTFRLTIPRTHPAGA